MSQCLTSLHRWNISPQAIRYFNLKFFGNFFGHFEKETQLYHCGSGKYNLVLKNISFRLSFVYNFIIAFIRSGAWGSVVVKPLRY